MILKINFLDVKSAPVVEIKKYQVGDIVSCKWTDRRYYGAKILEVLSNGKLID